MELAQASPVRVGAALVEKDRLLRLLVRFGPLHQGVVACTQAHGRVPLFYYRVDSCWGE